MLAMSGKPTACLEQGGLCRPALELVGLGQQYVAGDMPADSHQASICWSKLTHRVADIHDQDNTPQTLTGVSENNGP